jgi:hypothetical protein
LYIAYKLKAFEALAAELSSFSLKMSDLGLNLGPLLGADLNGVIDVDSFIPDIGELVNFQTPITEYFLKGK